MAVALVQHARTAASSARSWARQSARERRAGLLAIPRTSVINRFEPIRPPPGSRASPGPDRGWLGQNALDTNIPRCLTSSPDRERIFSAFEQSRLEVSEMIWESPSFVEVKMDAEINSYQEDFDGDF